LYAYIILRGGMYRKIRERGHILIKCRRSGNVHKLEGKVLDSSDQHKAKSEFG